MDNQAPVMDNATAQENDWRSQITDEGLKAHASLEKFKTPQDLFKSYTELERLVGKEKIPVPTEKDGKELWDTVYSRLGRPETPKGYKLPELQRPDGFPSADEKEMEGILAKAHELGLNNRQIGELYKWFMEGEFQKFKSFEEQRANKRAETETNLRKEWGKSYEEKVAKARGVLNNFSDPEVMQMVEEGLGNDPRFIRFLGNIAGKLQRTLSAENRPGSPCRPKKPGWRSPVFRARHRSIPSTRS